MGQKGTGQVNRLFWWIKHLGALHYTCDLGKIVRVDSHRWGDALFRECEKCRRVFVDFGSGL